MRKSLRTAAAGVFSTGIVLSGASAGHAVDDVPRQPATAVAEQFTCGPKTYTLVNRVRYGGAGWFQDTGQASNGDRAINTYNSDGRKDEFRLRYASGVVWGPTTAYGVCFPLGRGETARPEARNGGQWWEGQWRQG